MAQYKQTTIFIIVLLLFSYSTKTQEEKIQYKVEVKEKLLYVLALDKKGNPVTDLKKEDFQLFVDSRLKEIESFSLITHTAEKQRDQKKEIPAEKFELADFSLKEAETNKRFILAAIPNQYISIFQRNRAERALRHLVEQARYPEDLIGIVVIDRDRIYSLQDFTCSKGKLIRKINSYFKLELKKLSMLERQYPLTDNEIYQVPELPIFQGTIPVIGGIDIIPALNLIAEKMAVLKGRKIILCFTLPLNFLGSNTRISAFFDMVNKMLTHDITIYYSELKGPHIPGFFDASSSIKLNSSLLPGASSYNPAKLAYTRFLHESSHFALANETGGKYYYNISSPTYFIDDVYKMNSSYYLISFPISEKVGKKKSYSIQLKCKRKGVRLCYSNKYYAPHELEEKKFNETYKKIQLYKYLVIDAEQPSIEMQGLWILLPSDEEGLQVGFVDFYLPAELSQKLPISYQLGCSYSDFQKKGIFFHKELNLSSSWKDKAKTSQGYVARVLVKFTEEGKSIRLVAMDSESGKFGKIELDIGKTSRKTDFSDILLGKLVDKKRINEFRDYSEARYNLKKDLYKLLSLDKKLIIPSINNTFSSGEQINFCLIHKIPSKQSKRYKNMKVVAYLSLDKEGQIAEIKQLAHIKKVDKHYRQYYGTIDTTKLATGKYRIEINIKDAHNSIISALDAYFEILP